jgi:hypothetical protein
MIYSDKSIPPSAHQQAEQRKVVPVPRPSVQNRLSDPGLCVDGSTQSYNKTNIAVVFIPYSFTRLVGVRTTRLLF